MAPEIRRLLSAERPPPPSGAGYWFFVAHLLTVFFIAVSNVFQGLSLLWVGFCRRRIRRPLVTRGETGTAIVLLPLAAHAVVFVISVFASYDLGRSLGELPELFSLATLPLALLLVRGEADVRRTVDLIVWAMVGYSLFGVGQYLFTDYGPLDNRIPGPFSHYMTFSGVLVIGDSLVLSRLASGDGWRRASNWIALVIIKGTLFLTLTRHAWIAVLVVLTLVLWFRARRYFISYVGALLVAAMLTAMVAPDYWSRARSIVDLSNPSNYDRLCMAYAGLHMIRERPFYGIGPGLMKERYPIYRHPTAPRSHPAHLHSTFLNQAAERGLLSLASYFWLMVAGFLIALRAYRAGGGFGGPRADLYLGVMISLIAFNVAGLFEANWRDTEVQRLVLFLLALPCALESPSREAAARVRARVSGNQDPV